MPQHTASQIKSWLVLAEHQTDKKLAHEYQYAGNLYYSPSDSMIMENLLFLTFCVFHPLLIACFHIQSSVLDCKLPSEDKDSARRSDWILGCTERRVACRSTEVIVPIYCALVRPHLEHCIQLLSFPVQERHEPVGPSPEESHSNEESWKTSPVRKGWDSCVCSSW